MCLPGVKELFSCPVDTTSAHNLHFQVTEPHKCSQQQSATCLTLNLCCASSELRNAFHLSFPSHGLDGFVQQRSRLVLKNHSWARMQQSSKPLNKGGRTFGPKEHILKSPFEGLKSFLLASSCCAPQSPTYICIYICVRIYKLTYTWMCVCKWWCFSWGMQKR